MTNKLRNVAIIAHVDHGKTTLVDQLLKQSGTLDSRAPEPVRLMDRNDLEKERGITILSKNTAISWQDYRINIVDTPGHADFGGEVERVLSMVDSVLLLVDAVEGPMPQTRFVTQKAFAMGFAPIVVVNKIDRPEARSSWVVDRTFDLFDDLGASDEQLDFPVVYASAVEGFATLDPEHPSDNMQPLFETIVSQVPAPEVDPSGPFQMRISVLDYNSYVGVIGIGRIERGTARKNQPVTVLSPDEPERRARILQVLGFHGLERRELESASAGDIIAVSGIEGLNVSDTLCDREAPEALPPLTVDEPTISMLFCVNDSPFAGREGRFLTSRQVRERLMREAEHNVALRVRDTADPEKLEVSGRGELHLSVLIETMRREGYELAVSRPEVIVKEIDGQRREPYEMLVLDVEDQHQGAIMEVIGDRKGELRDLKPDGKGRVRLDYMIPARSLIGFQSEFRTLTAGTGIMHHIFDHYGPFVEQNLKSRRQGALISKGTGKALAYALFNLQERGRLMVSPGQEVYEGQVIGLHSRGNDLTVNPLKAKQLTNIRAAGKDENVALSPAIKQTLEQALEFIDDDELVEVTPKAIRIRKRELTEVGRKRAGRARPDLPPA